MFEAAGIIPDALRPAVSDLLRLLPLLLLLAGSLRWVTRRFTKIITKVIDDRIAPVHSRIDEHMTQEEKNLAEHDERLVWLSVSLASIAASLGVAIPPPREPLQSQIRR